MSVDQHVEAGRRWLDLVFAGGDRVSIRDGYQGAVEHFEFADGTQADALDIDFGKGPIRNSRFLDVGNDGIDASGRGGQVTRVSRTCGRVD